MGANCVAVSFRVRVWLYFVSFSFTVQPISPAWISGTFTLFFPAAAPRLWLLGDAMRPLRAVVPGLFILLCGMCTHLSRNNMRRGLWCALFAGGIRLVSGIVSPACPIRFGILHLLAL